MEFKDLIKRVIVDLRVEMKSADYEEDRITAENELEELKRDLKELEAMI